MASSSALFQIKPPGGVYGAAGVAQACTHLGGTVYCKVVDVAGLSASDIAWDFTGTHAHGVSAPTPTLSGNPTGQIMSFPFPAGKGQDYGIVCETRGGTGRPNGDTEKSAAYSINDQGRAPFFVGETLEIDPTHGNVTRLNAISNEAGGGAGTAKARAATTAALPANTYSAAAKRITITAVGALPAQDTITLTVGQVLLVKDEGGVASHVNDGPYAVIVVGDGATQAILERTAGADESAEVDRLAVRVGEGANYADHLFVQVSNAPTLDTTPLEFVDQGHVGALVTTTDSGAVSSLGAANTVMQSPGAGSGVDYNSNLKLGADPATGGGPSGIAASANFDLRVKTAGGERQLVVMAGQSAYFGDALCTTDAYYNVGAAAHDFLVATNSVLKVEATLITAAQPIAIGAAPAAGGALNLTNNEGVYGKDVAGNSARLLLLDNADLLWLGESTHVEATYCNGRLGVLLQAAGVNELRAAPGYVGFGDGAVASVGTTRYEKTTFACFRNNADDDNFVAWQTSDDAAGDSLVKLGGVGATADRPKYVILDASTSNLFQIAGAPRLDIQAAYYQWGASAACSATGTHRHEDNVSFRWLNGGNDYGAVSWAGTVLTLGGANATRPTQIVLDTTGYITAMLGGTISSHVDGAFGIQNRLSGEVFS